MSEIANAKLSGKVAVVTGASRGIGRAVAERLAADGAAVVVNYFRSPNEAMSLVEKIQQAGGQAIAIQADFSKVDEIRHLFEETIRHFGRFHILVQNPSIFQPAPIVDVTENDFDAAYALNAKGTFFAFQEAAKKMEQGGRVIYISSCSTTMSLPGFGVYVGFKAAGEMFARALSRELGSRNITVNTVSPGFTLTDMLPQDPEWRKMGAGMSPFQRLGRPEEVANVVAFLASDEADWVTGQNIQASGGVG